MLKPILAILATAVLATGCQTYAWNKPGATLSLAQQDQLECSRLASQQAFRDYVFRLDPFPSRAAHDRRGDPRASIYRRNLELDRMSHEAQLQSFCMRARGYELVPTP
jgi:hypothetical protein